MRGLAAPFYFGAPRVPDAVQRFFSGAPQPVGRVLFNPPLHARWRVKENPPYELTRGLTTPPAVSSLGGLRMPAPVCAAPPSWGRHPQTFSFATGSRQQKIRPCRLCPESENHFRTAAQMTENGLRCLMSEDGGLRFPRCLACRALRITANLSSRFNVICPTGKSDFPVQPFSKKFSTLLVGQIISTSSRHPVPREGRWPSSRTLGRVAVDAAASARKGIAGAGFGL